jgi:D-xylose transport system substrate-binding protein
MENSMKQKALHTLLAVSMVAAGVFAPQAHASKEKPVIGFSIDDLRVERWTRDRDYFKAAVEAKGGTVSVQSADANEQKQIQQIENLISRKVDVIVIVPFNAKTLTTVVAEAKKAGIKVISYDRLILNADVDAYISFDNEKVGEMQAKGVVDATGGKGNFFLLGGAPTDNNAKILREGQMKVLDPLVKSGAVKIVGQQWTDEWLASKAQSIIENALTANKNNIQGIVASNDGTAGGAIAALNGQKLAGKVAVSGQDADLAAVKRIKAGTQAMTVYKPIKTIATDAANLAVQFAKGETPQFTSKMNNGSKDINTILLTPTLLTKQNVDLVVKDGFYTQAQVGQ